MSRRRVHLREDECDQEYAHMYIHICAPGIFFSIISNIISGQMEKTQNMMICIVVLLYSFHCANVLVRKQCMGVKYNGVVDTLKVEIVKQSTNGKTSYDPPVLIVWVLFSSK